MVRNIIAFQGLKPRFFYTNCVEETFTGAILDKYLKDFSTVTGKNITKQFKKGFKKKSRTVVFLNAKCLLIRVVLSFS